MTRHSFPELDAVSLDLAGDRLDTRTGLGLHAAMMTSRLHRGLETD